MHVTSGATDDDHAVEVSKSNGYCRAPQYDSDADESDTRIWIHVKHLAGNKKYIFSRHRCVPYSSTINITNRGDNHSVKQT